MAGSKQDFLLVWLYGPGTGGRTANCYWPMAGGSQRSRWCVAVGLLGPIACPLGDDLGNLCQVLK